MLKTVKEAFSQGRLIRVDGGSAGVYYVESEQKYWEALGKITSVGSGYSIEVLK